MQWYVLFSKTGSEAKIERLLKKQLNEEISIPFIPMLETLHKMSGRIKKEVKPLFPGYVFIESVLNDIDFIQGIRDIAYTSNEIFRLLRYSKLDIALKESEKQMLLSLCNGDYCIETSSGILEGDKIYIFSGPLKGRESMIKNINRHKRQALIEIDFMGELRLVTVSLDIVKKLL